MALKSTTEIPLRNKLSTDDGFVSESWLYFFRDVLDGILYLNKEISFPLVNNQSGAVDLTPLSFDKTSTSQVTVDYLIQRTTSTNESVSSGTFHLSYLPRSDSWQIENAPSGSGVTLTITSTGQVQYTTTNQTGTLSISRIIFRARKIGGKSSIYSKLGIRK